MKRVAVVIYHRNIFTKYNPEWTKGCIKNLGDQTFQDFSVVELDFGGDGVVVYDGDRPHHHYSEKIDNLGAAISRSFDICFRELGFDLAFNINLDDIYDVDRFRIQLETQAAHGADVVSSNFHFVDEDLKILSTTDFCRRVVGLEDQNRLIDFHFANDRNCIGFPVCLFTKGFWLGNDGLPSRDESKGREDFDLWIEARKRGFKLYIIDKHLFKYRVHSTSISKRVNDL